MSAETAEVKWTAPPFSEWLTASEAGRYLRCSSATVLRAARSGQLKAFKLRSRAWRFRRQDLDRFLETSATPQPFTPKVVR